MYKYTLEVGYTTIAKRTVKYPIIIVVNDKGYKKVHPISAIVFNKWKRLEYNTQRKYAGVVVGLLNWLIANQLKIGLSSVKLSNLTINHLNMYLNEKNDEGLLKRTIKIYEQVLVVFCEFLVEQSIASNDVRERVLIHNDKVTFFEVVLYNDRHPNSLHDLRRELIFPFIEFASVVATPIALGVYYQMFGGLRRGEVVNIKRENVSLIGVLGVNGHKVKISQEVLRDDIKDSSGSSSIKPKANHRDVTIYPSPILQELYETHLKNYKDLSGNNALFVGDNGLPMTGTTYSYYFEKLKDAFIEYLMQHDDTNMAQYGVYLKTIKWGTHIGRGVFSNWFGETTDNPLDLARVRGDKGIDSSLVYLENTENTYKQVNKVISQMYKNRGGDPN